MAQIGGKIGRLEALAEFLLREDRNDALAVRRVAILGESEQAYEQVAHLRLAERLIIRNGRITRQGQSDTLAPLCGHISAGFANGLQDVLQHRQGTLLRQKGRYGIDTVGGLAKLLQIEADGAEIGKQWLDKYHVVCAQVKDLRKEKLLHTAMGRGQLLDVLSIQDSGMRAVLMDEQ